MERLVLPPRKPDKVKVKRSNAKRTIRNIPRFVSPHLKLVRIPPERTGEVTERNVVIEDVYAAMRKLQLVQETLETRNGEPDLNPMLFTASIDRAVEMEKMAVMLVKRMRSMYVRWHGSEYQRDT